MAITLTNLQPYRDGFAVNAYTADLSGTEIVKAAVTGKSIYLERITISCITATTVTIGAGETGGAVTATIAGPIVFTTTSNPVVIDFVRPIQLAVATDLTADAGAAGAVTILAEGYVE